MNGASLNFIKTQVGAVSGKKSRLQWLLNLRVDANRIVNFGCNIGTETLSLMYFFGAEEALGIDKDELSIHQAQSTFKNLREDVVRIHRMFEYYPGLISEEEKIWWENVPTFFKQAMVRNTFKLDYHIHDFTMQSDISSDSFDLAFCDFVLHHIWYEENDISNPINTRAAVQEMARVLTPGGALAAFELVQYDKKPRLDFKSLFLQVGLELIHVHEQEMSSPTRGDYIVGEYCFRKS